MLSYSYTVGSCSKALWISNCVYNKETYTFLMFYTVHICAWDHRIWQRCRVIASLSLPGGQDKNISSIFPHFPLVSLNFLKFSSFSSSFWSSCPPRKALAMTLQRWESQTFEQGFWHLASQTVMRLVKIHNVNCQLVQALRTIPAYCTFSTIIEKKCWNNLMAVVEFGPLFPMYNVDRRMLSTSLLDLSTLFGEEGRDMGLRWVWDWASQLSFSMIVGSASSETQFCVHFSPPFNSW